jgi:hypothetical protein
MLTLPTMPTRRIVASMLLAAGLAACAMTEDPTVRLSANLTGAAEVPPVQTTGQGNATVTLNKASKTLSWNVAYRGLTGPARAAHFHGPAAAGANAGVVVPMTVSDSPMQGSAPVTDAQIADLLAGRWYINIHTAAHQGGEIRGQVVGGN